MNEINKLSRPELIEEIQIFLDDVVEPEMDEEIYLRLKNIADKLERPVKPRATLAGYRCDVCNEAVRESWNPNSRVSTYCDKCGVRLEWERR